MGKKPVLLISFYNQKALGVRFLEKSLKSKGYPVTIVFFKGFNSAKPELVSEYELNLLKDIIDKVKPALIGLSVMTSLYLEAVYKVNNVIRDSYNIPIVWGGVYASLFPEKCLEYADFVVRGEGEDAIVELADTLLCNAPFHHIQNLAYINDNTAVVNDVRPLPNSLDPYGYPDTDNSNKYFIRNNKIFEGDPLINAVSYELSASRGCPFVCSYCSSINLRRIYKGKGSFIRFRSVESVLNELKEVKSKMKNLKFIHFWDEIFPYDNEWIDTFTKRYKSEINLPFEIWCHPLAVRENVIKKLVGAGLYKAVMGIQSGSSRIRRKIFHRNEKQEDIINASKILSQCKVPQIIYDFILRHPFETEDDLRETYELCTKLKLPYELQLHGLNFLPGTDIADLAVKMNIYTQDELDKIMYSPMHEQYGRYWGRDNTNLMINFWYALIFMTQYKSTRPVAKYFESKYHSLRHAKLAVKFYKRMVPLSKLRYYYKKCDLIFKPMLPQ